MTRDVMVYEHVVRIPPITTTHFYSYYPRRVETVATIVASRDSRPASSSVVSSSVVIRRRAMHLAHVVVSQERDGLSHTVGGVERHLGEEPRLVYFS